MNLEVNLLGYEKHVTQPTFSTHNRRLGWASSIQQSTTAIYYPTVGWVGRYQPNNQPQPFIVLP